MLTKFFFSGDWLKDLLPPSKDDARFLTFALRLVYESKRESTLRLVEDIQTTSKSDAPASISFDHSIMLRPIEVIAKSDLLCVCTLLDLVKLCRKLDLLFIRTSGSGQVELHISGLGVDEIYEAHQVMNLIIEPDVWIHYRNFPGASQIRCEKTPIGHATLSVP